MKNSDILHYGMLLLQNPTLNHGRLMFEVGDPTSNIGWPTLKVGRRSK